METQETPVSLSVSLRDAAEDQLYVSPVCVRVWRDHITLDLEEHGLNELESGCGEIIYLERYEGSLRLIVWADINDADPTHVIDLSSALESNRRVATTETTAPW